MWGNVRCGRGMFAGQDLTRDCSKEPQSDLVFACKFETDFAGKKAFLERRACGAQCRLLSFYLNDLDALVFGREPILREGEIVGRLNSTAYGWSVGGATSMSIAA